jgi:hypothetical protein
VPGLVKGGYSPPDREADPRTAWTKGQKNAVLGLNFVLKETELGRKCFALHSPI